MNLLPLIILLLFSSLIFSKMAAHNKNTHYKVFTTAKGSGHNFQESEGHFLEISNDVSEGSVDVYIYPRKTFQKFIGIGGSFTDASAENFFKLSLANQNELMKAYFNEKDGNAYRLARISIHSCDFSIKSHTYIDEGDKELESFSIATDKKYRIPFIKRAIKEAGGNITLMASPWSAPAFMKSNNNMLYGGELLPEYYSIWALYYTKFIKAYEKEGIPIWGITIQNEPAAVQRWESMIYTAEQERDFLKNHLGPTMHHQGLGDKKIIVWDHNRDLGTHRATTIFGDPDAAKYAWGTGFHWYETWAGGDSMQNNLTAIKEAFPDKHLIFTEGCQEGFRTDRLFHWPHAERYGEAMIRDFNVGIVGWCDWNLLLDEKGGPNHVGNLCFSPIHADLEKDELIYTPSYYYIGHFSRFIPIGAHRISSTSNRSFILTTSFLAPNNKTVTTVVMNKKDESFDYDLILNGNVAKLHLPARSIQTIVYDLIH